MSRRIPKISSMLSSSTGRNTTAMCVQLSGRMTTGIVSISHLDFLERQTTKSCLGHKQGWLDKKEVHGSHRVEDTVSNTLG